MAATTQCPQCEAVNPETHHYCSQCGAPLSDSAASAQIDVVVDRLQYEARRIEMETMEALQKRAIQWAKTQLFFLSAAVTIVVVLVAFFGYQEYTDFRRTLEENAARIEEETQEMREFSAAARQDIEQTLQRSEHLSNEVNASLADLNTLRSEMKDIDPERIHSEIEELHSGLQSSIDRARDLTDQAKADRAQIRKLQNSIFDIFVHLDGPEERVDSALKRIVQSLQQKGFVIRRDNIARIGVNTSEVIYYNPAAQSQAQSIAALLRGQFPTIQPRSITRPERNPREILLKLKIL